MQWYSSVVARCLADPPQTKQEENWFNEALKKAREIAKKTREGGEAGSSTAEATTSEQGDDGQKAIVFLCTHGALLVVQ